MKMNKSLSLPLALVALLTLAASNAEARSYDNIIRPYTSVRSTGMGGVTYTTGQFDENFFGNPAKTSDNPHWRLDIVNLVLEVNSGSMSNIGKLTKGGDTISNVASTAGTNNHVRIQTVIPAFYTPHFFDARNALAVGLVHSTQADIGLRKDMALEPNVFTDIGPAVTFSRKFLHDETLAVGVTAHYVYRVATRGDFSTIDYIKGNNFKSVKDIAGEGADADADLGMRHNIHWTPAGFQLQDAFTINNVKGGKYDQKLNLIPGDQPLPVSQPRTYNAGVAARKPGFLGFSTSTFAFELQDIGNNSGGSPFRLVHFGGEFGVKDHLYLRAGVNQGYLCAGVGFDLPLLKIDLSTYGEEMSLNAGGQEDRRYALRFGLSL
jgi:hypothetical protein